LVRGQRCPLRHCQRWNKKLAHFAVIVKSWWIFMPPWKLISELSTNEQGGAKTLKRALTVWGRAKLAENLCPFPFNGDLLNETAFSQTRLDGQCL
jgi:hypothetical protein